MIRRREREVGGGLGWVKEEGRVEEGRREMSLEKPDRTSVFSGPSKIQSQEGTKKMQANELPFPL